MITSKIAAVTVLYNPSLVVIDNLNTYINQVNKIFVVDNSEIVNKTLVKKIQLLGSQIEYIYNKSNLGVAAALNIAAQKTEYQGFKYLLTMDQDSEASPDMVSNLFQCFLKDNKIAVVSAFHQLDVENKDIKETSSCYQVITTMTSGNIVKLNILKELGGYNEDLFIDYVDHDFCLRLNRAGYKVYICSNAILKHKLGEIKQKSFFYRKVYPTNHSPLRLYYRTRNRFYLYKKNQDIFANFIKNDKKAFVREIIKILIYEGKKFHKIRMIILGYSDYRKNNLGVFNG